MQEPGSKLAFIPDPWFEAIGLEMNAFDTRVNDNLFTSRLPVEF